MDLFKFLHRQSQHRYLTPEQNATVDRAVGLACKRFNISVNDKDDVAQDTRLQLCKSRTNASEISNYEGFVYTIAWRQARVHKLNQAKRVVWEQPLEPQEPSGTAIDSSVQARDAEALRRTEQYIRELLSPHSDLSETERNVLLLKCQGHDENDIAKLLGLRLNSVYNILNRIYKKYFQESDSEQP